MAHPLLSSFVVYLLFVVTFFADAVAACTMSGVESGCLVDSKSELFSEILKGEAVARLYDLAKVSDSDSYLERTFLSPASLRADSLIRSWMQEAGLTTWIDQMGNLHGRIESKNSSAEALLIGSHLDTVIDAGMYDGALGIISAISALKVLKIGNKFKALQRPVEIIAFSDEEGVRFQSTFLGSAALAGILPASTLQISDASGITVQEVLMQNSIECSEESLLQMRYLPQSIWGYVEVHIEQGPVLEALGYPLGVVEAIAGQTRLEITVKGRQGHAGTVPMHMRQDPMVASAELITLLDNLCRGHLENFTSYDDKCKSMPILPLDSVVCTVGRISSWPGASNVIPLQVTFTADIRARDDMIREAILLQLSNQTQKICHRRSVTCTIERKHEAGATGCDKGLSLLLKSAAQSTMEKVTGGTAIHVPVLVSGAGHDAMAISHLTKVGMLFVRCNGGISHSPTEHVLDEDVWAAGMALLTFLEANLLED